MTDYFQLRLLSEAACSNKMILHEVVRVLSNLLAVGTGVHKSAPQTHSCIQFSLDEFSNISVCTEVLLVLSHIRWRLYRAGMATLAADYNPLSYQKKKTLRDKNQ